MIVHDPTMLCQSKLMGLRVAELKEVLDKLGLRKSGNKAELLDRISAIFEDNM